MEYAVEIDSEGGLTFEFYTRQLRPANLPALKALLHFHNTTLSQTEGDDCHHGIHALRGNMIAGVSHKK
jgi:hypothetical protein